MPIVVLGMHRSGTSLVASMLQSMGVNMGDVFLEADDANPFGYWEDLEWYNLNKLILHRSRADWYTVGEITRRKIVQTGNWFDDKITSLVEAKAKGGEPWGWKDPRTSLTCWVIHGHLTKPRYLVVNRASKGILKSLQAVYSNKDGYSHLTDKTWNALIKLYRRHILTFEKWVKEAPFLHVQYEDIMNAKKAEAIALAMAEFVGSDRKGARRALKRVQR